MPWYLVAVVFFGDLVVWIGSGFLGHDYSFALTFLPAFYVIVAWWGFKSIFSPPYRRGYTMPEVTISIGAIVVLWLTVIAWGLNALESSTPLRVRLFNLAIPASLLIATCAVWISPLTRRDAKRLLYIVVAAAILNAGLSFATFAVFNLVRLLPTQLFYVNPRYPVILLVVGNEPWVRVPGIFESGGSNGTFLLITASLLLAYLLLGIRRRGDISRSGLWLLLIVHAVLATLTLTRRSILAMGVTVILGVSLVAFVQRRFRLLGGAALLVGVGAVAVLGLAPDIINADTLMMRIRLWTEVSAALYDRAPWHLVFGFGILQSSLPFLQGGGFNIVDNGYLAVLLYGGVILTVAFYGYYLHLLFLNLAFFLRANTPTRWLHLAALLMSVNIFLLSGFVSLPFNATEALPLLLGTNLATKYALAGSSHVIT